MMACGRATLSKLSSSGSRDRASGSVTDGGSARLTAGATSATTITAALRFIVAMSAETPGCCDGLRRETHATVTAAPVHNAISPAADLAPLDATAGAACHAGHSIVSHWSRRDDP